MRSASLEVALKYCSIGLSAYNRPIKRLRKARSSPVYFQYISVLRKEKILKEELSIFMVDIVNDRELDFVEGSQSRTPVSSYPPFCNQVNILRDQFRPTL